MTLWVMIIRSVLFIIFERKVGYFPSRTSGSIRLFQIINLIVLSLVRTSSKVSQRDLSMKMTIKLIREEIYQNHTQSFDEYDFNIFKLQ